MINSTNSRNISSSIPQSSRPVFQSIPAPRPTLPAPRPTLLPTPKLAPPTLPTPKLAPRPAIRPTQRPTSQLIQKSVQPVNKKISLETWGNIAIIVGIDLLILALVLGLVFGLKKKPPHRNCLANLPDGSRSQANNFLCNVLHNRDPTSTSSIQTCQYNNTNCCAVFKSYGCTADDIPACAGGKFTPSPYCGPS